MRSPPPELNQAYVRGSPLIENNSDDDDNNNNNNNNNNTEDSRRATNSAFHFLVQMRSVSGGAFGSWSRAISILIDLPTTTGDPGRNNMLLVLGLSIPFALLAAVLLALIVLLSICITYHQLKMRCSLKVYCNE